MLTLDSSGIFAALDRTDPHHDEARIALEAEKGPLLVPMGILAEIAYIVEHRLGPGVLDAFLADLIEGAFDVECGEQDLPRAQELAMRYRKLPLGVADGMVIACAERHSGRVLTFDQRHFGVVAGEGTIQLVGDGHGR
jgi:predicted nucleic acid-binding protein